MGSLGRLGWLVWDCAGASGWDYVDAKGVPGGAGMGGMWGGAAMGEGRFWLSTSVTRVALMVTQTGAGLLD